MLLEFIQLCQDRIGIELDRRFLVFTFQLPLQPVALPAPFGYRQTGLEESAFEFIGMPGGILFEPELLQRSRNLMQVEINISDETPIEFIVIQALGEPVLEVPVYRKPQP